MMNFNKYNQIKFCDIHRGICQPDHSFWTQEGNFFWWIVCAATPTSPYGCGIKEGRKAEKTERNWKIYFSTYLFQDRNIKRIFYISFSSPEFLVFWPDSLLSKLLSLFIALSKQHKTQNNGYSNIHLLSFMLALTKTPLEYFQEIGIFISAKQVHSPNPVEPPAHDSHRNPDCAIKKCVSGDQRDRLAQFSCKVIRRNNEVLLHLPSSQMFL